MLPLVLFVLLSLGVSKEVEGACADVNLVTREEWGARDPTQVSYIEGAVNMTFIHHSAGSPCFDQDTCMATVRAIQDYHMDSNGWNDVGYSYLIGEDGNVYEGRTYGVVGSHTLNYNSVAYGFCILGDFMQRQPNALAITAVQNIIECGVDEGFIVPDYELFGHRDGRCTLCPGDILYALIRTWPHYSFRQIPIYC